MKIKLNPHAMAAAATLAGAVFFGAPGASAQQTPPATPPASTAPSAATPPPTPATPPAPAAGETPPGTPPPSGESKIHAAPPPPPVERHVTKPIVAAGVISGAALASGIIFGILAAGKNSKYKSGAGTVDDRNQIALDGERNAFISDISFGVAALFGLTAIALYLLPDEPPPPDASAPAAPPKAQSRSWITGALKGEVFSF